MTASLTRLYAAVALAGFTAHDSEAAVQGRHLESLTSQRAQSPTAQPHIRGLYFALAHGGEAWLVYLDLGSQASAVYSPFRSVAVCMVTKDSNDGVVFRSAQMSDGTVYQFAGQRSGEYLTGTLKRVGTRTGVEVESVPLTFHPLRARFLTGASDPLSGEYSAVRISEQSGDAYGVGVILIEAVDSVAGLWVEYEGAQVHSRR